MGKLRFHEGFQVRSSAQSWPVFLCIAGLVCTVLFSLLNPEPSQSLSGPERFVFWLAHAGGLLGLMQAAQILLMYIAPVRQFGAWPQIVLAGLIGALLFTPIALVLDQLFGLAAVTDDEAQSWRYRILDDFAAMAPPSVLTWVGLNAARHLRLPALGNAPGDGHLDRLFRGRPGQAAMGADPAPEPAPGPTQQRTAEAALTPPAVQPSPDTPFWSRVPPSLGRDLVALTAELHYLRVETTRGNALILYPFGQAVAELAAVGMDGSQIHRSHWVAHSHVVSIHRKGERVFCVLDNAATLPVGRRRHASFVARLSRARAHEGQSRPPSAEAPAS